MTAGTICTRGNSQRINPIVITAITAAAIIADLSSPCFLDSLREKIRISVEIPAIPTETKVMATVRLGTISDRSAAAPNAIAAKSGTMYGFFIVMSPGNYISTGMGEASLVLNARISTAPDILPRPLPPQPVQLPHPLHHSKQTDPQFPMRTPHPAYSSA